MLSIKSKDKGFMTVLEDRFGRRFPYLRLSVTDVCNFRCTYCLPNGYSGPGMTGVLSVDEIRRLVTAFAGLGTKKVRLTGGEPTLRNDLVQIIKEVAAVPGIETVAMTTNGYKLPERATDFVAAGVSHMNVSIDSLDPKMFAAVTGHDRLKEVMTGLEIAKAAGLKTARVNAVLMRGVNDQDMALFEDFVKDQDIDMRFIEVMRTGDNAQFFADHHVAMDDVIADVQHRGWTEAPRGRTDGPARLFQKPGYTGRLGFIAPYSKGFCDTCNRLRVTSRGGLRLCLFADGDHDLRPLLQSDGDIHAVRESVISTLFGKQETHRLHTQNPGATRHLAEVGG